MTSYIKNVQQRENNILHNSNDNATYTQESLSYTNKKMKRLRQLKKAKG